VGLDRRRPLGRSVGTACMGLGIATFLLWRNGGWPRFRCDSPQTWEEYYLLNLFFLLVPPVLSTMLSSKSSVDATGLRSGDLRRGIGWSLMGWVLFLPVIWIVSAQTDFQEYYVGNLRANRVLVWEGDRQSLDWSRWAFTSGVMSLYMLAWEWFFRGYLLFGLRRGFGPWWANLFQATLFCVLHLGKPWAEVASSLAGGLLLGFVALRLRSMLACFLIHLLIFLTHEAAILWHHQQSLQ